MSMTPTQQAVADEIQRFHRVKAQHGASEVIVVAAEEIVALKEKIAIAEEELKTLKAITTPPTLAQGPWPAEIPPFPRAGRQEPR